MHAVKTAGGRTRRRPAALAVALVSALALAIPALAVAHPQVYELTPKALPSTEPAKAECNYGLYASGSCLLDATAKRYAVANDGFAMTYTENGEGSYGGVVNYQKMPGGFRKWTLPTPGEMTSEQKREFALAQTPVQAHATCQGVAALESGPNILAWQGADPFFNYIPWQKTTANLGDEPSSWIPVVQAAVGVDLAVLSTEAEFKTACEGKGGTYRKADSPSNPMTNAIAEAVEKATEPLSAEVDALLADKASLQGQIDAWVTKGAALEAEKSALAKDKASLAGQNTVLAGENASLAKDKAGLEQQLTAVKKANTGKAKTIKKLRKQLKAARNG